MYFILSTLSHLVPTHTKHKKVKQEGHEIMN